MLIADILAGTKRTEARRVVARERRQLALTIYEHVAETTYWDVAMDMGISPTYVGQLVRRARREREWDVRQAARREHEGA